MLATDTYAGVNRLHDYGTIIQNTTNPVADCRTTAAPETDDHILIRRIHRRGESSPLHEGFFHVLLSDRFSLRFDEEMPAFASTTTSTVFASRRISGRISFLLFAGAK